MIRKNYLIICFISLSVSLIAGVRGRVVNSIHEPVDAVAVVMQTLDSVFVEAVITEPDGTFVFDTEKGEYQLFFQHLLYEPFQMNVTTDNVGTITLTEKGNMLAEVTVTGERPQVKVQSGTLIYDTPQLIQNKPVNNAFEAIRELPGIISTDESLELLGAGSVHIVMNGQMTTLTLPQLISLLKTIPASRVKSTEVTYNAPARYNVKGAVINVVLDQAAESGETLQGEVGTEYTQRHYGEGGARGNVLYAKDRFSVDVLVNATKGKAKSGEQMFARHTLDDGEVVEIDQDNRGVVKYQGGTFRLGADYTLSNQDRLSLSYYISSNSNDGARTSDTEYNFLKNSLVTPVESYTTTDSDSRLQNVQLQYKGHQRLNAGIDYTNYHSPDEQSFVNYQEGIVTTDLLNTSKQDIHKWLGFVNHDVTIAESWGLNYGINAGFTRSRTHVEYLYKEDNGYFPDEESRLNNLQKEYTVNAFGELSRNFGKLSAQVSLKLEYFRSDYDSNSEKSTLWNDWALFPNASLSYVFSPYHILQLNVSSDKIYPSYWTVNPQVTNLNSYSVVVGNPELKPSRNYAGQLLYIIKQKYILLGFVQYEPDKFAQLPYQSGEELQTVFRFENFDYALTTGIGFIIPFKAGKILDSRFTANGMRLQEKSDMFYDTPFNNSRYFGQLILNNTINLSEERPNLKLTVDGYFVSPAQQGIYKLGSFYNVSAGMKWLFAKDRATLTLKYNNIFRSNNPRYINVDFGDQYSRMKKFDDNRYVSLAFSWKFGGYKEKKHDKVDDSRFGR